MALTKASYSMISGTPANILDYGADPTGTSDSAAAFTAAFAASKSVYVPPGTFKIGSTITVPNYTKFFGAGNWASIIKPSSAVTGAAIEYLGIISLMQDLYIDGENTTGVIGVRVANQALSDYTVMSNVLIANFKGSGGKGLQILNSVRASYYSVYLDHNAQNCDIGSLSLAPAANNFPTIQSFYGCTFESATESCGLNIRSGFEFAFHDCTFEANQQAGVNIAPSDAGGYASNAFAINFYGGHFETNWLSISGVNRPLYYHMDVDGTGSGANVNNIQVADTYFNGGPDQAQAMKFNKVYNLRLRGPITQNYAATISAIGGTNGWLSQYQYAGGSAFYDASGNVVVEDSVYDAWTNWTPTFTPGGSMTFTSITVNTARYRRNGKTLIFELNVDGTTGGTAAATIVFTLPSGLLAKNSSYLPCVVSTGSGTVGGYARFNGTNNVGIYKIDGSNYSLGSTSFTGSFTIELT